MKVARSQDKFKGNRVESRGSAEIGRGHAT